MADLTGFDASKVEPGGGAIPKGEYQVVIVESDKVATKAGTGHLLKLKLQIVEGEHKGRTLTDRLNLWNPNEVASRIAQGTLSAICRAVNVLTPQGSEQLHHKQLTAVVEVRQLDEGVANEVKGYKPRQTSAPPSFGGATAPTSGKPNPFG
jgi:hypothetical protein